MNIVRCIRAGLVPGFFSVFLLLLNGCATHSSNQDGPPPKYVDVSMIPDAVPGKVAKSAYGNPDTYRVYGKQYRVLKTAQGYHEQGVASWYGRKFHGHLTSTREPYDMYAMTGASRTLPIPCFARVTNLENGKSVIVKINDRGPFASNRILDLSYVAAEKLGYAGKGTAHVDVQALDEHGNNWVGYNRPSRRSSYTRVSSRASSRRTQHTKGYLQIGSFHSKGNAVILKKKLQPLTHSRVFIATEWTHKSPVYQVRVGPLLGESESSQLQAKIANLGLTAVHVTG